MPDNYEEIIMGLITHAGACKSMAFAALQAAKRKEHTEAQHLLAEADKEAKKAHEIQTRLIGLDEGEGKIPVHLIMVHAQDHLMTAMLARELIAELILLHQNKD
ncbi:MULTISPECIES: PTS lactose/cellobiose transporter subunit IIA [Citrobacter]|uniref:PTS lactose/cellobiose transporter subunit IIA n=1 Tax=Citrobacter TaxID=544 RepID=UPI000DF0F66C|nr:MULTISPECIES: PTS lactose/cellobiose transporter subunit IIA [Citrobacter]MBJ9239593.1 PTS lactose/cellobiose transporter subunit IIA [Citrobacter braakii]TKU01102.1 PTS lactose/cellobiose transporter subunit IIA [Citrobacter sp. wls831]STA76718.1 PTS system, cellobiose-specific IIa component [Citrobacter freundii]SUX67598.1 PTS system, cellobiose-specific IIa component [Citrobacter freundii]